MSASDQFTLIANAQLPPAFCQYAGGPCDQDFRTAVGSDCLFLYPSDPPNVAATIEAAADQLRLTHGSQKWTTWKDLNVSGQIIFCEICKAIRFTKLVVADVTTLNFNLLFEIGYALGLGVPVLPVRDTSIVRDQRAFEELGLLDTLGYYDFQSSQNLLEGVLGRQGAAPFGVQFPPLNPEQPLFVVKSPVENDGMIKLMSVVKKSRLKFRSFDVREIPRISLHEAFKQVVMSRAVILHLVSADRADARVHNARCAFVAGIAMATQKHVLMLQEGTAREPIDYRDVLGFYSRPAQIPDILTPILGQVIEEIQTTRFVPTVLPTRALEKIDLGDLAAENEIKALESYFVPTAQFKEAQRGHARLVVGRKGSGKTAVFYGIRATYRPMRSNLVLDLKPEGHQFTKLREAVIQQLPEGVQQHVVTAFWNYLLVMELAHQVVHYEVSYAHRDARLRSAYESVVTAYGKDEGTEQADFSERLLNLVNEIVARRDAMGSAVRSTPEITQLIQSTEIRPVNDALTEYYSAVFWKRRGSFSGSSKGATYNCMRSCSSEMIFTSISS